MRNIRVLHIGLSSNVGGIETVVHSWLKYKPEWLHFDFIQIGDEKIAFEEDFINSGARIYRITPRSANIKKSNKELRDIVEKGHYDFVHHHLMSFSWPEPALVTSKHSNSKIILHAHTVLSGHFSVKYRILHFIGKARLKNAHYIEVACSEEAGKAMDGDDAFAVVKNGIDFTECQYNEIEREKIRAKYGFTTNNVVIGHVGRSAYEKNYPFLLKTFKVVQERIKNARLLLIGDILADKQIQDLIDELSIRDYVTCTGAVRGIRSFYSAMDIYYMPSIIEGVSVSLLEAQASGLTCVVSENVSKESAISERCLFVPISDAANVAELIIKEADMDNIQRNDVALDNKYDLESTSKKMFDLYESNGEIK